MAKDKKIVITGVGVISPIGIGKDKFADALLNGKEGFRRISLFDTSMFKVHVAGEIADFDPVAMLGKKNLRTLDRTTRFISAAAGLALTDSKLNVSEDNTNAIGISIGTTFGSLHSISQFDRVGITEGPRSVNPSHFPNTVLNSPSSQVAIRYKIKGFNTTISTGFCSGLDSIFYAADFISLGRAKAVLAGAVEELCEETFLGFHELGCLSGIDGTEPVCRPFDAERNGIIFSEGAAVLVLEEERSALERGAEIIAEIKGYGSAFDPDANRTFTHKGQGLKEAIILALNDSSLHPQDIDFISACSNSSRGLDRMETWAIKEVFAKFAFNIPVSSIKSMLGETFSASGAFSVAAAAVAMKNGFIPPTINYGQKDPNCDLDYVPNTARHREVRNVLVTTADPYGNNTVLIIGKHE